MEGKFSCIAEIRIGTAIASIQKKNMGDLAGEAENGGLRPDFDARLRLEFREAKVTTDAGLPAARELDGALGLMKMAELMMRDKRPGGT